IHIWMGRLDEAEASARRLIALHDEHLRRCGRRLPIAAFGYARLSEVLLQRNQLPQALAAAQESRALAEPWQQMDALFESYTHLARAFHAGGDAASALALLHRLEYLIRDRSLWLTSMTQMEQARLYLASPQDPSGIERAYSWAAAHPLPAEGKLVFRDHALYLTHTLLMLHEAATDRQSAYNGRGLIDRLLPLLEASGAFGLALQASVLGALLDAALGEVDSALGRLLMCLRQAEPQGYVRLFVDHGAPMYSLLTRVPATEPTYAYARELLGALASPSPPTVSPARPAQASLVEPLSDRELDVLRLLATALTAAEIADELCVATSTVRSHTKAIYGKLGVHTRLEAIDAARGLGLIPSL
ncbi:MAG TPA: LuxR C-terminal-related transcriptional regulator, partial [Anaerolineales bacterium]|nr:LuxR C-terminal-related transcriptional regulator [Anaerolineales bacterium]